MADNVLTLIKDEDTGSSSHGGGPYAEEMKLPQSCENRTPHLAVPSVLAAGSAVALTLGMATRAEAQGSYYCDNSSSSGYDFVVGDTQSHFHTDMRIVPGSMVVDPSRWQIDTIQVRDQLDHGGQPCGGGDGIPC